jgi:hypothetical protein
MLSVETRDRFPSAHPVRQALRALNQRVRQPSDLAGIGHELSVRFAEELPVVPSEPLEAVSEPEELAQPHDFVAPLAEETPLFAAGFDTPDPFDAETVRPTSPTMVPSVEPKLMQPDEGVPYNGPVPVADASVSPSLHPVGPAVEVEDVTSADVGPSAQALPEIPEVSERRIRPVDLEEERGPLDIRRVAPAVVVFMVLTLVAYLLTGPVS